MSTEPNECVVLVHGLGVPAAMMRLMQRRFEKAGYRTHNFGYASTRGRIDDHAQRLRAKLHDLARDAAIGRLHVVTHSLGGVVARTALLQHPPGIGRVVMLAPPNRGSPVATALYRRWPKLARLVSVVEDLSEHEGSWINKLGSPAPHVEVGIISATHDWIVPATHNPMPGITDQVTLRSLHGPMVWHRHIFEQSLHFIRHGRFAAVGGGVPVPMRVDASS